MAQRACPYQTESRKLPSVSAHGFRCDERASGTTSGYFAGEQHFAIAPFRVLTHPYCHQGRVPQTSSTSLRGGGGGGGGVGGSGMVATRSARTSGEKASGSVTYAQIESTGKSSKMPFDHYRVSRRMSFSVFHCRPVSCARSERFHVVVPSGRRGFPNGAGIARPREKLFRGERMVEPAKGRVM